MSPFETTKTDVNIIVNKLICDSIEERPGWKVAVKIIVKFYLVTTCVWLPVIIIFFLYISIICLHQSLPWSTVNSQPALVWLWNLFQFQLTCKIPAYVGTTYEIKNNQKVLRLQKKSFYFASAYNKLVSWCDAIHRA